MPSAPTTHVDPPAAEPAHRRPLRLAVMQPYLFPYLGYFRLISEADRFVFYDDVAYIRGGWINRNRWLLGGVPRYFTVPLRDASSYRTIADTEIAPGGHWRRKLLATLHQHYRRAPHYAAVAPLVEAVLAMDTRHIGTLAKASVRACAALLELPCGFVESAAAYDNAALRGQARVLDICAREGATVYLNLPSGRTLYDAATFAAQGVALRFLETPDWRYAQPAPGFVPALSVIDALMHAGPAAVRAALKEPR